MTMRWRGLAAAACVAAAAIGSAGPARAGVANQGIPGAPSGNPIAGLKWGPVQSTTLSHNGLWDAYAAARGARKRLLAKIALQPGAYFIGSWISAAGTKATARAVVQATQQGNPNVMTQFKTFPLAPWEGQWSGSGSWNVADREHWYRGLAAGIGDARALVIVQIDLPFAAKTPNQAPEKIDTYAAKVLSRRPHTTVYIDAGADGWLSPEAQGALLLRNGIRSARGFSVADTQYGSMDQELTYGQAILGYLDAHGVHGKRFLVDTAQNGTPYLAGQVSGNSNDTPRCASPGQTLCQRTGIPPTTNVAAPRWHLSASDAAIARRDVDGYLWVGEPWTENGGPFNLRCALTLAANGRY